MSVIATVKVYDGIVLGAESMTQLIANVSGQSPQLVKAYENAQKLFQIGEMPIGLLTYGIGNIGRRSVESFAHEFSRIEASRADKTDVSETTKRFFDFIQEHYNQAFGSVPTDEQPGMGFVIAGYSDDQHSASEWEFILPQHTAPVPIGPQDTVGAIWRGVGNPFTRLMFGIDPGFEQKLRDTGASEEEVNRFKQVINQMKTNVAFDGMPLADAIGYCRFIIQTTIGWCKYALGWPACGGPIKLATITRGAGFEWITPPKSYLEGVSHAASIHI